jgi:hypothetical protein
LVSPLLLPLDNGALAPPAGDFLKGLLAISAVWVRR